MKMAKKFLAVALAGVLALSVLTGCGNSVKSKDVADALNKMGFKVQNIDIKVEQDDGVDKIAKETLNAIEAIIASAGNTAADEDNKITLDNAVKNDGKIIRMNNVTDTTNAVRKALGLMKYNEEATDAEKANSGNNVRVALVKTENATKDASLQAALVKDGLVPAKNCVPAGNQKFVEPGKLGSAKTSDGKYILVVIVTDIVEKTASDYNA